MDRLLRVAACATLVVLLPYSNAAADNASDIVMQKLAALEARVATLETRNQQYKRELAAARAQARLPDGGALRVTNRVPANVASAMAYKTPISEEAPRGWNGAYWGASAGGAVSRSNVTGNETLSIIGPVPFVSGYSTLGNSSEDGRGGGLIDLYAGWNFQFNRLVLGAQLEGTATSLDFSSTGSRTFTYFDAAGPTGQAAIGDFRPQVTARWMTSALLRAGVLLNEGTLLYVIGGWTGAQFEVRNVVDNPFYQPVESFWSNGWTAGAGVERKLGPNWSVRAEYRYTDFARTTTTDHAQFVGAGTSGSQINQATMRFDQSMQSGRIGFAYAFDSAR